MPNYHSKNSQQSEKNSSCLSLGKKIIITWSLSRDLQSSYPFLQSYYRCSPSRGRFPQIGGLVPSIRKPSGGADWRSAPRPLRRGCGTAPWGWGRWETDPAGSAASESSHRAALPPASLWIPNASESQPAQQHFCH